MNSSGLKVINRKNQDKDSEKQTYDKVMLNKKDSCSDIVNTDKSKTDIKR